MLVEIIGPNLPGKAQEKGQFHVHAHGCRDATRLRRQVGEPSMVIEAECCLDVEAFVYDFAPTESEGYTLGDWLGEFHFAPCCSSLPTRATTTKGDAPMSKFANLADVLENGSGAELAQFLNSHPNVPDSQWKSRAGRARRRKGETRQEFIDRVLIA